MLAVGLNLITHIDEMNDYKADRLWRETMGYIDKSGLDSFHPLYNGHLAYY